MSALIALTMKASALLAIALLLSWRARRSAAVAHLVLAAGIAGAAALPLAQAAGPRWSVSLPLPPGLAADSMTPTAAPVAASEVVMAVAARAAAGERERAGEDWPLTTWLLVAWAAGAVTSALWLLAGLLQLRSIRQRGVEVRDPRIQETVATVGRRYGIVRPIRVLGSASPLLLATWGWRRPVIMLPADAVNWPLPRLRLVLAHELAHVLRADAALQTLAGAVRAALWFNPLAWLAARRLQDASERACDDLVLRTGVEPADYAAELLAIARQVSTQSSWMSAPAMARSCSLERRVAAMFDVARTRQVPARSTQVLVAASVTALTLALGGYGVAAQGYTTFSGAVRDPQGGTLGGATVVLQHRVSGQKYEVRSNDAGVYEFVGVAPGDYDLQASRPGFKTRSTSVAVAGGPAREDLLLDVGSLQETITVRAVSAGQVRTTGVPPTATQRVGPDARDASACVVPVGGGQLKPPTKVKDVRPIYPPELQQANVGGSLSFTAVIATDGSIREVTPSRAENPQLAAAAMEAIRQWRFTPTLLNCQPIEVEMSVAVSFRAD